MKHIARDQFTFKMLANLIRSDPTSWRETGILYLRPCPATLKDSADLAVVLGQHGDAMILGAIPADYISASNASIICHIHDIYLDWQFVVELLGFAGTEITTTLPTAGHAKTPLTMLIVEDDPLTSKLVSHHLQQFGKTITTKNAREAIANNNVTSPDMIFLDIHYHDDICDGFDVLTNILSTDKNAFVIIFSADRHPATIMRALSLGAQGFIAKPFHGSDFAHYLDKFWHTHSQ